MNSETGLPSLTRGQTLSLLGVVVTMAVLGATVFKKHPLAAIPGTLVIMGSACFLVGFVCGLGSCILRPFNARGVVPNSTLDSMETASSVCCETGSNVFRYPVVLPP